MHIDFAASQFCIFYGNQVPLLEGVRFDCFILTVVPRPADELQAQAYCAYLAE